MLRILFISISFLLISCNKQSAELMIPKESTIEKNVKWARFQQGKDRMSDKAIKSVDDLSYFEIDPNYYIIADFLASRVEETINIPTYSGAQKEFYKYGIARFKMNGLNYELSIYRNIQGMTSKEFKDYLFLPFMDETSGEQSYGGGRYIDLKISDIKDGKVVLDFNRAYNPYCAYGTGWNCPIPPKENHLPLSIMVGESAYSGPEVERAN